jgi:hypothetical protein
MPATSKKQYELMAAVAHGWKGGPKGLSAAEAKKYISSQPTAKGLPDKAKPKARRR